MHEVRAFFDGQNVQFLEPLGERAPQDVTIRFSEDEKTGAAEPDLVERFEALFQEWFDATAPISGSAIFEHPAHQKIINLGMPAVPLILKKLVERPFFVFSALRQITGENPVKPEHAGKFGLIAQDWLQWGRENGQI